MKRWIAGMAGTGLLAWAAMPALAQSSAAGFLETKVEARKVARTADGSERLSSPDDARAGDVIEYVARYRNTGPQALRNVEATIAIPEGTEFVPGSTRPHLEKVSADGRTYGPQPLMRKVQRDGRETLEQVLPREYRFLRWTANIDPRQTATFTARVRVRDAQ